MRRLIINADDFGLTAGVNRAIAEAHDRGVLTSATLMANGEASEGAVELARFRPRLSVGCHVVLVDGDPVLGQSAKKSLLDPSRTNATPHLRWGIGKFAAYALLDRLVPHEIEQEVAAQIGKLQTAGLKVSHLDSHKHTHIFPQVLKPILRAAQACGIKAIRNPFERVGLSQLAASPALWRRWSQVKLLGKFEKQFREAVRQAGMIAPDGSFGIVATGALDERLLRLIISNFPNGVWELVCHPGYNDSDLRNISTRLRQSREEELSLLTSPSTRELLAASGIEVISYRDLAALG